MITAARLGIVGGAVGYGPDVSRGQLRDPAPGTSATDPATSPAAERGFLTSWKSSLAKFVTDENLKADMDSAPTAHDASSLDSTQKPHGLSFHRPKPDASPRSVLSSAINTSKQRAQIRLRIPDVDLHETKPTRSIAPHATDSESSNENSSSTVRTERGASGVLVEKDEKREQADGGSSTATPVLTAAVVAVIAPPVPSPVPRRLPDSARDCAQSSPEIESATASASRISFPALEGSDAMAAESATRKADVTPPADPTQTEETRAAQSPVALVRSVEEPQSGGSENFSVDNPSVPAALHGTEFMSLDPPNHGSQVNTIHVPQGNGARPAEMGSLTDPSGIQPPAVHNLGTTPSETGSGTRSTQVPKGPASRLESALAASRAAHHAAAATEYANPVAQNQQNFSSTRVLSIAVQAPIADEGNGKPESGLAVRDNTVAAASDPFVALDAASGAVAPTWTHTGARQAEAGFHDPAFGWVGVRAEVGTAGIHASLVPGSADAAQVLSSHLAGLNDYLEHHKASVHTVTVAAPESHSSGMGMDQGAGHSGGQQKGSEEYFGRQPGTETAASPLLAIGDRGSAQPGGESEVPSGGTLPADAYISVFA